MASVSSARPRNPLGTQIELKPGPLGSGGDGAVNEEECGQDRGILMHLALSPTKRLDLLTEASRCEDLDLGHCSHTDRYPWVVQTHEGSDGE